MEFLILEDVFSIFLLKLENYCQNRFQKLSLQTNWIFLQTNWIFLLIKVKLVTVVEGDQKAPFSIATTLRGREGR